MEREDVVLAMEAGVEVESIYKTVYQSDGNEIQLLDKVAAGGGSGVWEDEEKDRLLNHMLLEQLLEELPEADRDLIRMRYFENMTQSEVAKNLGISQVQVSRLEKKNPSQHAAQGSVLRNSRQILHKTGSAFKYLRTYENCRNPAGRQGAFRIVTAACGSEVCAWKGAKMATRETLYLKLERNVETQKKEIHLSDLGKLVCADKEILARAKALKVCSFRMKRRSAVWSA